MKLFIIINGTKYYAERILDFNCVYYNIHVPHRVAQDTNVVANLALYNKATGKSRNGSWYDTYTFCIDSTTFKNVWELDRYFTSQIKEINKFVNLDMCMWNIDKVNEELLRTLK